MLAHIVRKDVDFILLWSLHKEINYWYLDAAFYLMDSRQMLNVSRVQRMTKLKLHFLCLRLNSFFFAINKKHSRDFPTVKLMS